MDPRVTRFDALLASGTAYLTPGGFVNQNTGFGSASDKLLASYYQAGRALDSYTLAAMFHGSDLAARVVSALPEEEFRPGFDLEFCRPGEKPEQDDELSEKVFDEFVRLEAWDTLLEGRIFGRAFGGAATVIGADDGLGAADPLDVTRVRQIDWLLGVDRRELVPNRRYASGPKAGKPETYWVVPADQTVTPGDQAGTFELHETRLILWPGERTARRERVCNNGWDYSVLDRLWPVIQSFESTWKGSELLAVEASQGIFKMPNLAEKIVAGKQAVIAARMAEVDKRKSSQNSILLDETETYERIPANFAGLPDLLKEARLRVSSAALIPVLILFGQQVGGLGQEGSNDLRWFFDRTRVSQRSVVEPRLLTVVRMILATIGRTDVRPIIKWRELWTPTALEIAQEEQARAATDAALIQSEMVTAEELVLSRFANGRMVTGYSGVDVEARKALAKRSVSALGEEPPDDPSRTQWAYPKKPDGQPEGAGPEDIDDGTD